MKLYEIADLRLTQTRLIWKSKILYGEFKIFHTFIKGSFNISSSHLSNKMQLGRYKFLHNVPTWLKLYKYIIYIIMDIYVPPIIYLSNNFHVTFRLRVILLSRYVSDIFCNQFQCSLIYISYNLFIWNGYNNV